MDYNAAFQISATGMALEKTRLEATAANLASMNVAAPSAGQAYQPVRIVARSNGLQFAQVFGRWQQAAGGVEFSAQPQTAPARMVHDPGHPYADSKGMVAYPAVDHAAEMVNMNIALRAYEANVAAMTAARTMAARALEIGGQQ
jgi:flagellar basal-body rod protein FlgC